MEEKKKKELKSYVKLDAKGRVIIGSKVKRTTMPKIGKWKELINEEQ